MELPIMVSTINLTYIELRQVVPLSQYRCFQLVRDQHVTSTRMFSVALDPWGKVYSITTVAIGFFMSYIFPFEFDLASDGNMFAKVQFRWLVLNGPASSQPQPLSQLSPQQLIAESSTMPDHSSTVTTTILANDDGWTTVLNRFQLSLSEQVLIPQIKIASSSRLTPMSLVLNSTFGFPFLSYAQ